MELKRMTICAFMFSGILFCTPAFALDELYLCGVVQNVDGKKAMVSINVKSDSCPGVKLFQLANPHAASRFIAGENKCFSIDSNNCRDNKTHKIILGE